MVNLPEHSFLFRQCVPMYNYSGLTNAWIVIIQISPLENTYFYKEFDDFNEVGLKSQMKRRQRFQLP